MTKTKIERLKAIKEEFARTQAALANARQLEESAQAHSMAVLLENDLDQAELILAAQDMMNKLQNMAEDLAKMNAQDLFPLVDKMKGAFGQEAAHTFEASAQEALTNGMNTVRRAKDEVGNSIMRLEGKVPANDMASGATMDAGAGMEAPPAAPAPEGDQVDSAMDDFGGAEGASGPQEEPLGRARKESVESTKTALSESVILESAGRRLLETEGLESLISWVLAEAATGMPEEHFRSFATSIATKAAKDPVKLAGWIGKKKHGMAAMAQLAEPTRTQAQPEPELAIAEGKTFKNNDEDDDNWDKKSKDKSRQQARSRKADKVDEGKSFKNNDEDDDNWDKKSKDVSRQQARKNKAGKMDEATLAANAIAQLIEASIAREGKGNAARAVAEAVAYLAGKNLVEGEQDPRAVVLEAFQESFGMKPAAYSVLKLREFMAPLSDQDKKTAADVVGKLGQSNPSDPNAGNQSISSAMAGMDPQQRTVANKMLNQMRANGQNPQKVSDFTSGASSMMGGDQDQQGVNENINAAHWPTDTMGQYKGEPMQTDYEKLKPLKTPKAGATETTSGGESEAPKASEPKSEEPKGNPFAKKEESKKDDSDSETVEEGVKDKLKKAAMGAGAVAAVAGGSVLDKPSLHYQDQGSHQVSKSATVKKSNRS